MLFVVVLNLKCILLASRLNCLGVLLLIVVGQIGCRSLQTSRHTRNLTDARQLSLRGAGLLQQQNYTEAGPLFSEALRHSTADERAQWGMAEVHWQNGDQQQAIQHMSQATILSGRNPDLIVRLGEMHLEAGQLDAAFTQAEAALEINRQHAQAWALRAQVLRQQGQSEQALECYQRALIHNADDTDTRVALAEIYHQLGRPQRALATLDQLADSRPTEAIPAEAWILKGQAFAALGEQPDAQHCLRQAAACSEAGDPELLLKLAELQYRAGDLAEARVCLGRALQQNPQNGRALALQAQLDQSFDRNATRNVPIQPAKFRTFGTD